MAIDRRKLLLGASTLAILGAADMNNTKERVVGIGGLFFRSRDPKALADWYQRHLGIDPSPTEYHQPVWQQAAGPTVFAPFPADTDYFGSPQQAWMVNFRVRNLDAMITQLRAAGIAAKVDSQVYPNGRFARLHDPEGNPIELWEPAGPNTHS
jgi:predicted enzyme related to lactoylglutathione lyase